MKLYKSHKFNVINWKLKQLFINKVSKYSIYKKNLMNN